MKMQEINKITTARRQPAFEHQDGDGQTTLGWPWVIPEFWTWTRARDIAQIVGGGTPRTIEPANFDGDIPWITPADLSGYTSKFISRGARSITKRGLDSSGARMMPAGTVLFSSRAPIGYVAIG
jgi:type I restriction enzyme S subunit